MRLKNTGFSIVFGIIVLGGCSPKPTPPSINSANQNIDFPACRKTSLNFSKLEPENFKAMVACLNGQNGSIQPYKDLFDSMSSKDLASLLDVFNLHFFNNPERRNQILDIINRLHARGDLHSFMQGLAVAAQSRVIENAAPLFSKVIENNNSEVTGLEKYFTTLVDKNLLGPGLIALANHFGGLNSRALSLLFSSDALTTSNSMKSDQVVDLIVSELKRSLDDGAFKRVLLSLTDSELEPSSIVRSLDDQERIDLAQYLVYSTSDLHKFSQIQNLAKISDHSVSCFTKDSQYLNSPSLFLSVGREVTKRAPGPPTERFFLQTLPLLLSTTEASCSYPSGVLEAIKLDEEIIRLGYGNGKRALFKAILSTKKVSSELAAVKSDYFFQAGPIFQEMSRRGTTPYLINLLGKDVTAQDSAALSQLIDELNKTKALDQIISILKTVLSENLHPLGKSLVISMGDSRGGLGNIIGAFAQGVSLSDSSKPFQDAVAEILRDESLMVRIRPIFFSILRDERFPQLIAFTGQLAADGQLEKIAEFLAELLKNNGLPGLTGQEMTNSFHQPSLAPSIYIMQTKSVSQPPIVADAFPGCKNLEGSLFDNGTNLYTGLQCFNGDRSYPQMSKITDDLKNLNLLDDTSSIFRNIFTVSPHFVGALNQLNNLDHSKELDTLFKLFSWAAESPYGLPYRLDLLLQDAFRHKEMPEVLKAVGEILRLESFDQSAQAVIDVSHHSPTKIFQSQTDFRLTLKDEGGVRSKIASWYPNKSSTQIDSLFANAKENFETHNKAWLIQEGSYPDLNETQWRQELFTFLENILRTTDIKEIILALQQIAREGHLPEFLTQAIDTQRVTLHYFSDGTAIPHIMTDWDQLGELTQDANFIYTPLDILPVSFHVGVKFQQMVVDSNNFVADAKFEKFLADSGINLILLKQKSGDYSQQIELTHLQNMKQNFGVLDAISENGNLRIFQILYAGLLRATPPAYRNKNDAHLNHMGSLFHLTTIGFFEASTMAMASMESQGQLQHFLSNFLGVVQLLGPADIEPIRQTLLNLISKAKVGDTTPLDALLNKMQTTENDKKGYQNIKDALFHVLSAIAQVKVEPTGILKALPVIVSQPAVWNNVTDSLMDDAQNPEGSALTISSNILKLNSLGLSAFKRLIEIIFLDDSGGKENPLAATVTLLSDLYTLHPKEFSDFGNSFQSYLRDSRVVAVAPAAFFRNIFTEMYDQGRGENGWGNLLGDFLVDPASRGRAISLGYGLAKSGDIAQLSQFMVNLFNSGDFEGLLHFIFDNFSSSSLTSNR